MLVVLLLIVAPVVLILRDSAVAFKDKRFWLFSALVFSWVAVLCYFFFGRTGNRG